MCVNLFSAFILTLVALASRQSPESRVRVLASVTCHCLQRAEWSDEEMFYSSYYFKAVLYRGKAYDAPPLLFSSLSMDWPDAQYE